MAYNPGQGGNPIPPPGNPPGFSGQGAPGGPGGQPGGFPGQGGPGGFPGQPGGFPGGPGGFPGQGGPGGFPGQGGPGGFPGGPGGFPGGFPGQGGPGGPGSPSGLPSGFPQMGGGGSPGGMTGFPGGVPPMGFGGMPSIGTGTTGGGAASPSKSTPLQAASSQTSKDALSNIRAAVKAGDLAAVQAAITPGVDITGSFYGSSAMHWAAAKGDVPIAQALVGAGALVNAAESNGTTPLHVACNKNHVPMIQYLIGAGADPRAKNDFDETAFDLAKSEEAKKALGGSKAPAAPLARHPDYKPSSAAGSKGTAATPAAAAAAEPTTPARCSSLSDAELEPLVAVLKQAGVVDPIPVADVLASKVPDGAAYMKKLKDLAAAPAAPAATSLPPTLVRGLASLGKGKVTDAYRALEEVEESAPAGSRQRWFAILGGLLCRFQLGEPADDLFAELGNYVSSRSDSAEDKSLQPANAYVRATLLHAGATPPEAQAEATAGLAGAEGVVYQASLFLAYTHSAAVDKDLPAVWGESAAALLAERALQIKRKVAAAAEETIPAATKWEQAKERGERSAALDQLMEMTGLELVKHAFVDMSFVIALNRERGLSTAEQNFNVRFDGNPGTGKTTVARMYATFLREMAVLPPSAKVVETNGAALVQGGVSALKKQLEEMKKEGGGVLFVDEAYQLNPADGGAGRQVLEFLLPVCEKLQGPYGPVVVVFAGYKDLMDALMAHNPGLPDRFPHRFHFSDYTDDELLSIFDALVLTKGFAVADPRAARVGIKRIGRLRGTPTFGNARAVRNFLDAALQRQAGRILRERDGGGEPSDVRMLVRDDLLGPKVSRADLEKSPALKELRAMVGLEEVKQSVTSLIDTVLTNAELEELEMPQRPVALNRLFLGNPGTGKTTVARLYARLLRDLGLLSKGDVLLKNASDFVGSVLGESEQKTRGILANARGSVLVIDEAYGLYKEAGDQYRSAVIDTIVEQVQARPGEDMCVLMLGYKEEMEEMVRKSNPGLARRFQLENAFMFEDYDDDALVRILVAAARTDGLTVDTKTAMAALAVLARQRRAPHFGNAGAVNNLLSAAKERMMRRLKNLPIAERAKVTKMDASDFGEIDGGGEDNVLEGLVGCDNVKKVMQKYSATMRMAQQQGQDPTTKVDMNFVFVGPPGTGKTTVARRFGVLFQSLGIVGSADVVEVSARDLTTGFSGQAAGKTREVFTSGLGRVLFIDEAYRLNPAVGGSYMSEVLDEMVSLLTSPDYARKMVVILAGYESEMDAMLSVNPGLRSRFTQRVTFENMSVESAATLLRNNLQAEGLDLSHIQEIDSVFWKNISRAVAAPQWANGRDINNLTRSIYQHVASKWMREGPATDGSAPRCTAEDLAVAIDELVADKIAAAKNSEAQARKGKNRSALPERHAEPHAPQAAATKVATGTAAGDGGGGEDEAAGRQADSEEAARAAAAQAKIGKLRAAVATATANGQAEEAARMLKEAEELEDEEETAEQMQEKLRSMGVCPAGFKWTQINGGWRCGGGSHFVSNEQLKDA